MENESAQKRPANSPRLTRRARLLLVAGMAATVATAAVLVPLLLLREEKREPRSLLIPEGWRSSQVYAAVDKALGVTPRTTEKAAGAANLNLPRAAKGNPEGFFFPATYPIDERTTPASLISYMVNTAGKNFGATPAAYRNVVIASIVQAEADTAEDMGKVARVIDNRLARRMPLQMDSTINYALKRSTLDTSHADTTIDTPYNTYQRAGLPPTPIGNPGRQAMDATLDPPPGDWLYFVTVAPGDTRFTDSYAEQRKNVAEFNANRKGASKNGG
ncbi:endolytic transglycosylase MltG [Streptomyces sp. ISL-100]|uniref:endolytic transglycosylase MltG n=1 Tax=Streptomyces sp. ISL-100 TaxID=2819173 RepID=UPI001BE924C5|nr:endolytic transglycosylase MltG [Streptomyces sp. ISL-100]MBT2400472.1 endolytic transglycosylase MltG [Streptomyces sp. ISL-100]